MRLLRHVATLLLLTLVGVMGAVSTLRLAGPTTQHTDLADVVIEVRPTFSEPGVALYVPLVDWGVNFRAISAPLQLRGEPRAINRAAVSDAVSGLPVLKTTEKQLRSAIVRALLWSAGWALAGALVAGALLAFVFVASGRTRSHAVRRAVWTSGSAAAVVVVLGGWSALSYDASSWNKPTYHASGAELARLLAAADEIGTAQRRYRGRLTRAVDEIGDLLHAGPVVAADRLRLTVASDLHNNVLALPALQGVAAGSPVFFTGDFTHNGSRAESTLLDGIEDLGQRVVAVSGNHDSAGLMRTLARRGVTVLTHTGRLLPDGSSDGRPIMTVGDVKVAGFEDPLEFTEALYPPSLRTAMSFGDQPYAEIRTEAAVDTMMRWLDELPERPDVLMVHQSGLARRMARRLTLSGDRRPLTILSGHSHRQQVDFIGAVTVVDSGSAGAGGALSAGHDPFAFAQVSLQRRKLTSVDLIDADPLTGAAGAVRVVPDRPDCRDELVRCETRPVSEQLQRDVKSKLSMERAARALGDSLAFDVKSARNGSSSDVP